MSYKIKVFVDGKEVPVLNDVKIVVENYIAPDEELGEGELHFTYTHEGRVTDYVQDGEVLDTVSIMYDEIDIGRS